MQRSSIFSFESLPQLGLDRERAPWGLVVALVLLAVVEFGLARQDFVWGWVPHSDAGIVDVLEERVLHEDVEGYGPRVLLFGNSRLRDGVAPRNLERRLGLPEGAVVNLSLTRGTPFDAEVLYRRNRELLKDAHVAFFGVDVIQLDGRLPLNERVRRFATFGDRALRFEGSERIELLVGWFWRTYDARDAIRRLIKTAWKKKPKGVPIGEDGRVEWRTKAVNRRASRNSMRGYAALHFRNYQSSPDRRRHLQDFARMLEADGIEVVFVQVPVRSKYARHVRRRHWENMLRYEDDVRRSVGDRPLLMWWDSEFVGLRAGHFYDYGHVKDSGAAIFTRKLGDWLNEEFGDRLLTPRGE